MWVVSQVRKLGAPSQLRDAAVYATGIAIARGGEFGTFMYAAKVLPPLEYGKLEFQRRLIEYLSVFISFGAVTLVQTAGKHHNDTKVYLYRGVVISLLLVLISLPLAIFTESVLALMAALAVAYWMPWNSVIQSYLLSEKGSWSATKHKIATSMLLFGCIFIGLRIYPVPNIYGITLVIIAFLSITITFKTIPRDLDLIKLAIRFHSTDWFTYIKQAGTVVLSSLVSTGLVLAPIFLVKVFARSAEDLSLLGFFETYTSLILVVPLTLTQSSVKRLKAEISYTYINLRWVVFLATLMGIGLIATYQIWLSSIYPQYSGNTSILISMIFTKTCIAASAPIGYGFLVMHRYESNFRIGVIGLIIFLVGGPISYHSAGLPAMLLWLCVTVAIRLIYAVISFHGAQGAQVRG